MEKLKRILIKFVNQVVLNVDHTNGKLEDWVNKLLIRKFDKNSEVDFYDLKDKYNKKMLYYSKLGNWSFPNKKAYTLEDTGNGYIFTDHLLKTKFNLDYCTINALLVLAKLYKENPEFSIFEKVNDEH